MEPNSPPRGPPLPLEWGPINISDTTFPSTTQTETFITLIRPRLASPTIRQVAITTLYARYLFLNLYPQETDPQHHAEMLDLLNVHGQDILLTDEQRIWCAHQAVHYALRVVVTRLGGLEDVGGGEAGAGDEGSGLRGTGTGQGKSERGRERRRERVERREREIVQTRQRVVMNGIIGRASRILGGFGVLDHIVGAGDGFAEERVGLSAPTSTVFEGVDEVRRPVRGGTREDVWGDGREAAGGGNGSGGGEGSGNGSRSGEGEEEGGEGAGEVEVIERGDEAEEGRAAGDANRNGEGSGDSGQSPGSTESEGG